MEADPAPLADAGGLTPLGFAVARGDQARLPLLGGELRWKKYYRQSTVGKAGIWSNS